MTRDETTIPDSIYGPVRSWRLGKSLGIDILCVDSICSFECVYCQLGKINRLTAKRDIFVSTEKVMRDLENSEWQNADVITFSGSGEPTLAKNLGEVISGVKMITGKPVIVLTNSTLLHRADVRKEIVLADKIFCKLDASESETLRRVNRPLKGISFDQIALGIEKLRREFTGFLAIQTMIIRLPKDREIERFADILRLIDPDEVQLNLPTRPIPKEYFVETRGNTFEPKQELTRLKTISKNDLEFVREQLSELTDIPIITR